MNLARGTMAFAEALLIATDVAGAGTVASAFGPRFAPSFGDLLRRPAAIHRATLAGGDAVIVVHLVASPRCRTRTRS